MGLLCSLWACGDEPPVADQPQPDAGAVPDAASFGDGGAPGDSPDSPIWVDGPEGLNKGVPWLRLSVVDVGQGDGLVIHLPGGQVMAVDGGPADQHNAYAAFLDAEGVTRIDYMLLTHAHADHYSGLNDVTSRLPSDCEARVLDPGYDRMDVVGYKTLRTTAGCRYRALAINQSVLFDPQVEFQILGAADMPFPSDDNTGVNNTSLMLHLRYGRFTALLPGDSENQAEALALMRAAGSLPATVLKAGHHGSCTATATSFLRAVHPAYVLISAGPGNVYGHPNCQTIAKLQASTAHWYRTDLNGDLRVITDGTRYTIVTGRGSRDDASCPRDCANYSDF